jgi:hypothetical protein
VVRGSVQTSQIRLRLHSEQREDELAFWEQEKKAVYKTWERRFNT